MASTPPDAAEAPREPAEAAVVETVTRLIRGAIEQRASDIHLDPTDDGRGRVRLRVDGVLRDVEPPPDELFPKIVSRIKIMADVDLAERLRPQDGRIRLKLGGKVYDLRVSVLPTILGARLVLRILDRESVRLDLERIGFRGDEMAAVRDLCRLPNGIVLVTGPTGSGKTTTLYALLHEIDRKTRCVLSVENPVEFLIEDVGQVQVAANRGLTFSRAIRSILRQDPDVILVGEVRDLETANVCVQSSLTGHLVLTALHANTAPGVLRRLVDMGLEPFLVNATVAGVVAQRLVRILCPTCKRATDPPLHSLPPGAAELVGQMDAPTFCEPTGCEACKGMGYRGRIGVHEILIPDDRVRRVVAASSDLATVRNAALAAGMRPMLASALDKAARGITSIQEVCRVVPHGPGD